MSANSEGHQAYEAFRNLVANQEQEFGAVVNFFQEKLALEQSYGKENEKLNKRYAFLTVPNSKSSFDCMAALHDLINCQNFEHSRLRLSLQQATQELLDLKKVEDINMKSIKEMVKPVAKRYAELLNVSVPKAKQNYFKKAELEKEKEKSESGLTSQKVYKISKDIDAMEHIYRSTVVMLEETRNDLSTVKDKANQEYVEIEKVRSSLLKKIFNQLADAMKSSHNSIESQIIKFSDAAIRINAEQDRKVASDYFALHWPDYETTFAESFKTGQPLKDMVFGVPLSHGIRNAPSMVPPLLTKCFDAIEARGLDTEGLYRISPNKADFLDLKIQVETDVSAVDFSDETLDLHLLTGLVKSYLRDLPTPLLVFPPKERMEYSSNPNPEERLLKLGGRLQTLPREKFAMLKALTDHLHKLSTHSSKNKMSISNLAMVFSGVLFQNQSEPPPEPAKTNWFPSKQQTATPDLSSLDFLKVDLVMEDMLTHSTSLFKLFSKDSKRQGLSYAFSGSGMKLDSRRKSEEKIEPVPSSPKKLSLGSLFNSNGNVARKESDPEASKSNELAFVEACTDAVPALPQRMTDLILLTDNNQTFAPKEEDLTNLLTPTFDSSSPTITYKYQELASKSAGQKLQETVPRVAELESRDSVLSFKSAKSMSSQKEVI